MGLLVGQPLLSAPGVSGAIAHNETVTIHKQGAEDFGTKPTSAKPLMVWRAEDNSSTPNSTLGRLSAFTASLDGRFNTNVKATNSDRSWEMRPNWSDQEVYEFRYDIPSPSWDKFYVFVRCMWNGTAQQMGSYRTRTSAGNTGLVSVGDWGRGVNSPNATGEIEDIDGTTIYWRNDVGTISYLNEENDFVAASTVGDIDVYATQSEAESGSGTILETFTENEGGSAPFRNSGNKDFRFGTSSLNNFYVDHDGVNHVERTGGTSYAMSSAPNGSLMNKVADEWFTQEITLVNGTEGVADSTNLFYRNGVCAWGSSDKQFINTSATYPNKFDIINMHGYDNWANLSARVYNDYVVYDDSQYYVLIADSATLNLDSTTSTTDIDIQFCPASAWASDEITFVVQRGTHATLDGKTIHVIVDGALETSRTISS